MKASDRCKEHFQGDRCLRERGHEGPHESNNVLWLAPENSEGYATQKHPRRAYRRNRSLNRAVKQIVLAGKATGRGWQVDAKILKSFEQAVRG